MSNNYLHFSICSTLGIFNLISFHFNKNIPLKPYWIAASLFSIPSSQVFPHFYIIFHATIFSTHIMLIKQLNLTINIKENTALQQWKFIIRFILLSLLFIVESLNFPETNHLPKLLSYLIFYRFLTIRIVFSLFSVNKLLISKAKFKKYMKLCKKIRLFKEFKEFEILKIKYMNLLIIFHLFSVFLWVNLEWFAITKERGGWSVEAETWLSWLILSAMCWFKNYRELITKDYNYKIALWKRENDDWGKGNNELVEFSKIGWVVHPFGNEQGNVQIGKVAIE